MDPEDRGHDVTRRLVACTGLLILAAGLLFGGLSSGAALTEVLGFVLTLASLAAPRRTDPPLPEEDLAAELESQVRRRWSGEASTRRLTDRDFVPLSFLVPGSAGNGGRAAEAGPCPLSGPPGTSAKPHYPSTEESRGASWSSSASGEAGSPC
jgi:hypothetical protein